MFEGTRIGKLVQCQAKEFINMETETQEMLYIHKHGFDSILVKVPQAVKKTHCWRLKFLQILEIGPNQIRKIEVSFNGEMILTLWEKFNECICDQILSQTKNPSSTLKNWCKAPLTNIYVTSKKQSTKDLSQAGFLKVTPLLFPLDSDFYFKLQLGNSLQGQEINQNQFKNLRPVNINRIFNAIDAPVEKQRQRKRAEHLKGLIFWSLKQFTLSIIEDLQREEERNYFFEKRKNFIWMH